MDPTTTPPSGRPAQTARSNRILDAARHVLLTDPTAPVSAVAEAAGVSMSALYRRYPSKQHLLAHLAADGLRHYRTAAETALTDHHDPWATLASFLRRIVDTDTHTLLQRLAGTFLPTKHLYDDAERAQQLTRRLLERTKTTGAVRADLDVNDLTFLFDQLATVRLADQERTRQLRHRYLALLLDGLHTPTPNPLPGPPPTWTEIRRRWDHPANR
jgi:AcrR family transcriptional regulator